MSKRIQLCAEERGELVLRLFRKEATAVELVQEDSISEPTLVTDNGSCFLARKFQERLEGRFSHVRIQYRTLQQLGLLERFHATLKKEEVYWRLYEGPNHARQRLDAFRERYNRVRPHWALRPDERVDPLTPADVYEDGLAVVIPKWQGWARAALSKLEEADREPESA